MTVEPPLDIAESAYLTGVILTVVSVALVLISPFVLTVQWRTMTIPTVILAFGVQGGGVFMVLWSKWRMEVDV